jgi:predicted  nucleic acid-binding Zn-ribbon protein
MEVQTTILVVSIIFLAGAFFSWIGGLLERAKLQPKIDEEHRLKLQLELRHQRDEETTKVQAAEAQQHIKEITAHSTQLEQQLAARQSELAQAKAEIDKAENEAVAARQRARELELQLLPVQTRVADLEGALSAERGRLAALQTALEAKQDLVQQLTNELTTTNNALAGERSTTQQLRDQLAETDEAGTRLSPTPPTTEEPRPEYLAKLHEELAATKEKCLQLAHERDEARSITKGLAVES